ncbi:MAG: cytochrome c [Elusimicrobia bacterium]|nr:cytochrome c [Elusimicrobiota bacterium]
MKVSDYASSEELRRIGTAFLTVVGAITLTAIFLFTVVPGLRKANRPSAGPQLPSQGATGWLDPTEYPASQGYEVPPVDPKTVMSPEPAILKEGTVLFDQYCVTCHGPAGKGDGPAGATLNPLPRDFTKAQGWKHGAAMSALFQSISAGVPGSAMTRFDHLSAKDRMALVHAVRSFAAFDLPKDDPAALESLSKLVGSTGRKVSNVIPLSLAMELMLKEYQAPEELKFSDSSRKAILDPGRASLWLAGSSAWRKSPSALASAAAAGAPSNGFAPSAAKLTPAEWQSLFSELSRLTSR